MASSLKIRGQNSRNGRDGSSTPAVSTHDRAPLITEFPSAAAAGDRISGESGLWNATSSGHRSCVLL
jgi:hypothetical protein